MNLGRSAGSAAQERGAAHGPASAASGAVLWAPLLLISVTDASTVGVRAGDERVLGGRRSRWVR
jgi:hypothetical protein